MWPFKKKPKAEPEVIHWKVPHEHAEEVCRLYDAAREAPESRLACYKFWRHVELIIPKEYCGMKCKVTWVNLHPVLELTKDPK